MFLTIDVTFNAILKIADAFLAMFTSNVRLGMFVTSVAGIGGEAVGMAGLATAVAIAMPDREGMRPVIRCGFPGRC